MKPVRRFLIALSWVSLVPGTVLGAPLAAAATESGHQASQSSPMTAPILTPQGRLRKLSRQIRGIDPSLKEYSDLTAAVAAKKLNDFFAVKTAEYLKTPEHVGRMIQRLDELFRVQGDLTPPENYFSDVTAKTITPEYPFSLNIRNSMDYLFKEVAEKNESWDNLLTAKHYSIFFQTTKYQSASDNVFFRGIFSQLEAYYEKDPYFDLEYHDMGPTQVASTSDDPRLAGALTTARFLTRYTTTDINKNRRRAAAVFRIFLCEPMQPVVQESLDDINGLLDQTFSHEAPEHQTPVSEEDLHGTDPRCITCHERLDPLGQSFGTSGLALMSVPAPGRLFFRRADGSVVNVPGRGVGDLAEAITQTPEYAQCQVKHFWDWFIGTDVPFSDKVLTQLTAEFNKLGRRTDAFIAYLVSRPEFYTRPKVTTVSYSQVSDTLAKCTACHMGEQVAPDFTKLPIGGTPQLNEIWISKIIEALDLRGNGSRRYMPVKDSQWQPSASDLKAIKGWIRAGAPDDNGQNSLSSQFVQRLKADEK